MPLKYFVLYLCLITLLGGCQLPEARHKVDKLPMLRELIPRVSAPSINTALPSYPQADECSSERLFNVEVVNVPVKELLYALARDAGIDIDIHPEINEKVSLIAKNQSLRQIVARLSNMIPIRVKPHAQRLIVEPDRPYYQRYPVDYLNIQRTLVLKTQIASSLLNQPAKGRAAEQESNTSSMLLHGGLENQFWPRLKGAVCQILLSTSSRWHQSQCNGVLDKAERSDVTLYPEVGLLIVHGTQHQQKEVEAFIAEVSHYAKRQVLIEATLIEVELNEGYEAGIDWSLLMGGDMQVTGQLLASNLAIPPFVFFSRAGSHRLQGVIKALETFGHTKVLSSPRIMALNNQTAVLKVVNEEVYFTLQIKEDFNRDGEVKQQKFESQLHTVPVGLIMNVTPQIAADGMITLHVRPSITSIGGYKDDPAVSLHATKQNAPIKSQVPILQVREFDSMLSIPDQHIAVLGGLIRDDQRVGNESVPFLGRIPLLGGLFQYQNRRKKKSELVIFLRPQVVNYAIPQPLQPMHLARDTDISVRNEEGKNGQ
jgi:general secretion pathway protein D